MRRAAPRGLERSPHGQTVAPMRVQMWLRRVPLYIPLQDEPKKYIINSYRQITMRLADLVVAKENRLPVALTDGSRWLVGDIAHFFEKDGALHFYSEKAITLIPMDGQRMVGAGPRCDPLLYFKISS